MKTVLMYYPMFKDLTDTRFRLGVYTDKYEVQTVISHCTDMPLEEVFKDELSLNKIIELDISKLQDNTEFTAILDLMVSKMKEKVI